MDERPMRYEIVSRRALLKASAGIGAALVLPVACGSGDAQVFAGAVAESASSGAEAAAVPTTAPLVEDPATSAPAAQESATPVPAEVQLTPEAAAAPDAVATPEATAAPAPTTAPTPTATPVPTHAVAGEMIVSFTYTQAAGGKNERPYIAVWVENEAGELAETISLWYEQGRRGERWLDHLDLWWERDQTRIVSGGVDDAATISSATRQPGAYAVAWDGSIDGVAAIPGLYYVCIEAAREEGPHSLIREPMMLAGNLAQTALPNDGELSAVTVRIDV